MSDDASPPGGARLSAAFADYAEPLRRHALRLGAPADSADDVVSEAFAAVAGFDPQRLADIVNLRAYLFAAVTANVRTLLRHRARERPMAAASDEMLDQALVDFTGPVEVQDTMVLVRAALETLSDRDRTLLRETLVRGRTPRDVASELGIDGARVRTALHRARARFRLAYVRAFIARTPPSCGVDPGLLARIALGTAPRSDQRAYAAHRRTCSECPAMLHAARTEMALGSLLPIALVVALAASGPPSLAWATSGIPPPVAVAVVTVAA